MGRLIPLLFLVDLALVVFALIDCLSCDEIEIRVLPRFAWVLLILLAAPIGPIVWFVAGRPLPVTSRLSGGRQRSAGGAGRPRPLAPDDDPEFLRSIGKRPDENQDEDEDEERLRRWEADLRRREEELRQREEELRRRESEVRRRERGDQEPSG